MTGRSERTGQDVRPGSGSTATHGGGRDGFELANAVEAGDTDEPAVCYIYPADASDTELEARWLRVPARLLVDLPDAR